MACIVNEFNKSEEVAVVVSDLFWIVDIVWKLGIPDPMGLSWRLGHVVRFVCFSSKFA